MSAAGDRDPLPLLVQLLDENGYRGPGRMFRCPAHDDHNPSLSLSRATRNPNAAIVLHCHAGCTVPEILAAISALDPAHHWTLADLFWKGKPSKQIRLPSIVELEAAYRRGELHPLPITLGQLPTNATDDMRRVCAHYALIRGLYEAAGEYRPTPYSARLCARRVRIDKMRANRALNALVTAGVIVKAGELEARNGHRRGTAIYLPALLTVDSPQPAIELGAETTTQSHIGVDQQPDTVEVRTLQPIAEIAQQ